MVRGLRARGHYCGLSLTKSSLYALTRDVHARFPREIRDIIYGHLLAGENIKILASCNRKRLEIFSYPYIDPPTAAARRGPNEGLQQGIKTPDTLRQAGLKPHFMDANLTYPHVHGH
jgi:hypothetical protein